MPRDRSKDLEFLDMPLPVAVVAFLSAVALIFLVLKSLISYRLVFGVFGMEPTAQPFDWAVVDRHAYAGSTPRRGDIVLLNPPDGVEDIPLVFRVVGLPGEWIKNDRSYIGIGGVFPDRKCKALELPPKEWSRSSTLPNDELPDLKSLGLPLDETPDWICTEKWRARAPTIRTIYWREGRTDFGFDNLRVPKDRYFVLGDNRAGPGLTFLRSHNLRAEYLQNYRDEQISTVSLRDIKGRVLFFIPTTKYLFCRELKRNGVPIDDKTPCGLMQEIDRLEKYKFPETAPPS